MKHLLLALALAFSFTLAQAGCYSEGMRVGTIQKFSAKGFTDKYKSWEGELVVDGTKLKGGYKSGTSGGNVWAFSVLDPAVAKTIDGAAMSGKPVALRYCQVIIGLPETQTPYRITQAVERAAP